MDPTLRRLLGDNCDDSVRDVFDVVLSDGTHKTKCVLAPALNSAVWRGQVTRFDVMWVSEFHVLSVQNAADASARAVCVVTEFEMIAWHNDTFLVAVASPIAGGERQKESDSGASIAFVSRASERETGELPVAGERSYYLPLGSDQYPLAWEAHGPPTSARQVCADPFASAKRIHTIREIQALVESDSWSDRRSFPPLTGVVRVKSRVTHVGDPALSNPFPFVFHIIVGA